ANHASPFGESVGVTHREDRPVPEACDYLLRRIPRGPADEQNVAPRGVFNSLKATDDEGPRSPVFPAHGGIEEVAERVAPQNPDDQRARGTPGSAALRHPSLSTRSEEHTS